MTKKKNILPFPDNLNVKLSGIDTLRLHKHGQAIFVHLTFEEKLNSIENSFLIKQILIKEVLDFQITDFGLAVVFPLKFFYQLTLNLQQLYQALD